MTLQITLDKVRSSFLDLLFPPRCIGCGKEGEFVCANCQNLFPRLEPPFCDRCGCPLIGEPCRDCRDSPLVIDGIRSTFLHEELAREAVHQLKYRNMKVLARPLAVLMARYLESQPLPADVIMAVPVHPRRLRQRGYNQADLLAEELGLIINLPVSHGELIRQRNTASQVSLGAQARRNNVEGAFRCKEPFHGKKALLIDDVCTTGATLNACAITLKEAGAVSVWGLTFSREC